MRRPLGELAHHRFVQLSRTCADHHVAVKYKASRRFVLPALIESYRHELDEYWRRESPDLKDFDSIICVTRVGSVPVLIRLTYQPTNYFSFLYSNYSLDVPLPGGVTLRQLYDDGKLGCFSRTADHLPAEIYEFPSFGNSLGITISVVTADEQFIAAKRSETAKGIARDKGNWLCAVGTQIKRHQPRFLDEQGVPHPNISAREGLKDEMGEVIANSCTELRCVGLVYRDDFHHCELLYETTSTLEANDLVKAWRETPVPDRREFETIVGLDLRRPEIVLNHLADQQNRWSPQHAAGALHSLVRRFPELKESKMGIEHCII